MLATLDVGETADFEPRHRSPFRRLANQLAVQERDHVDGIVEADAKLDGTETPIKGDIGGTTASVKKLGPGSYQETDKRRGKITDVITMTVGADGKLSIKDENKLDGSTTTSVANKQ